MSGGVRAHRGQTGWDALVFGPVWIAAAAAALLAAAGRAMGIDPSPTLVALVFCGTSCVYTLDRLRDLARDRLTAPERSAFVARHRRALQGVAAASGLLAVALALGSPPGVAVAAGFVGLLGLLHRRLKHGPWAKPFYLTGAWTAVAVGLPLAAGGRGRAAAPVAAVVALTLLANVLLSSLRDGEGAAARLGRRRSQGLALLLLAAAGLLAAAAGPGPRSLLALPTAMAAAAAGFRPGERYGLWVVDGALLVGALVALALPGPPG